MHYCIGYYDDTADGRTWTTLKSVSFDTDAQAEAEVRVSRKDAPVDMDGAQLSGLYIRRGDAEWFCRFGAHD